MTYNAIFMSIKGLFNLSAVPCMTEMAPRTQGTRILVIPFSKESISVLSRQCAGNPKTVPQGPQNGMPGAPPL